MKIQAAENFPAGDSSAQEKAEWIEHVTAAFSGSPQAMELLHVVPLPHGIETEVLYANEAAAQLMLHPQEELLGAGCGLPGGERKPALLALLRRNAATRRAGQLQCESRVLGRTLSVSFYWPASGYCICQWANAEDTPERLYRDILNQTDDAVLVGDCNDQTVYYANEAAARLAQKPISQIVGKKCCEYLTDSQGACVLRGFVPDASYNGEADGCWNGRRYQSRCHPLRWKGREAFVEILSDITDQQDAAQIQKTANEKIHRILDAMPCGMLIFRVEELELICIYSSTTVAKLLGIQGRPGENDIRTLRAQVDSQDQERLHAACTVAVYRNRSIKEEFSICPKGGAKRWIEMQAAPVNFGDGTRYYCAMLSDVTEKAAKRQRRVQEYQEQLRKVREELRYQETSHENGLLAKICLNMNRYLVESYIADTGISVLAEGMPYGRAVEALGNTAKYPADAIRIRNLLSLKNLLESAQSGAESHLEYLRRKNDGDSMWVRFSVRAYHDPVNHDLKAFAYTYNIDAQKTTAAIIDRIMDHNYQFLGLLNVITGNIRSYRMSNKIGEIPGKEGTAPYNENLCAFVQDYIVPAQRQQAMAKMSLENVQAHLEKEDSYVCVFHAVIPEGEKILRWSFSYLDSDHHLILFTRADVTEMFCQQQKQQNALEEALYKAERASQAKADFLSHMSHEMRTPMNAIIGLTTLAQDETEHPACVKDYLNKIQDASGLLLRQINDVLDMTRIENMSIHLNPAPYQREDFFRQMDLLISPLCEKKSIHFLMDKPTQGIHWAMADKVRINQIFFNLLSNAVKYTPQGGSVSLKIDEQKQPDGEYLVQFVVADTGIGMSEEFQKHMFEPFSREDTPETQTIEGTGLGLSIVKQLVEMMHGTISVESAREKGTTFTVVLPMQEAFPQEQRSAHRTEYGDFSVLAGKRILLTEDNRINAIITRTLLEKKNVQVDCATNGQEAVEHFAAAPGSYDAILMDVRMPIMNGLDAARAIRALACPEAQTVPIIALSANAFAEDIHKAQQAGMNAYLSKPIEPQDMYHTLAEQITHRATPVENQK
ncbi:MAG: ATP-binding protein [Faecalibacterium sp.]|nr:ATP-binding protein [Faecalibacterium sp.]